jgi:DNA-binding IclR family transcriptional regulator
VTRERSAQRNVPIAVYDGAVPSDRPPVESVDRALALIQILSRSGTGLSLDELTQASGLPKSSLHRTLAALKRRGFATQQRETGRYFLGSEMLRAAFDFHERLDVRALLRPVLIRLRQEFNETVHVGVLDGGDVVYLDKLESSHPIKMTSAIGGRNPSHCTGVGKVLLAWTYPSDASIRAFVSEFGPLRRRTRTTITTTGGLAKEMGRIRERGYALDLEESELGVRCIAFPVFVGRSVPQAAISVSAPRERLSDRRLSEIATRFRQILTEELSPSTG